MQDHGQNCCGVHRWSVWSQSGPAPASQQGELKRTSLTELRVVVGGRLWMFCPLQEVCLCTQRDRQALQGCDSHLFRDPAGGSTQLSVHQELELFNKVECCFETVVVRLCVSVCRRTHSFMWTISCYHGNQSSRLHWHHSSSLTS